MAKDGFNFNEKYCNECDFRKEKGAVGAPDKNGVHCPAGRKSNPLTYQATLNVVRNNGRVCSMNPARRHFGWPELKRIATA